VIKNLPRQLIINQLQQLFVTGLYIKH
jgi:hypothetical protein